jgi:hypothetical protein
MSASFTAGSQDGDGIASTAKLWIVPFGELLVMIVMTASDDGLEDAQGDFDRILESIDFD